jgi:hypothetical protein
LGAALAIVGKPLGSRIFNEGVLGKKKNRPKVQEILNFELFFVIKYSIKLQQMVLKI